MSPTPTPSSPTATAFRFSVRCDAADKMAVARLAAVFRESESATLRRIIHVVLQQPELLLPSLEDINLEGSVGKKQGEQE